VLYVPTARPEDASTLDGGTSLHIAGGRRDVGQQSMTSRVEAHTATMKPSSGPSRRVSFYSDVHPDIGQLATEIEQIKKVCVTSFSRVTFNNEGRQMYFHWVVTN